ncbi:hypothetical protein ACVWXM_000192 [Bradyrhizobium sp. GM7.3]
MQHLPNDTIDILLDQFGQIETAIGDPNFPTTTDAWGGNDTVTATITQPEAEVTIFGDDNTTLHGQSHGGNDTLTVNVNYGWNAALVVGDAQADDGRRQGRQRHDRYPRPLDVHQRACFRRCRRRHVRQFARRQ